MKKKAVIPILIVVLVGAIWAWASMPNASGRRAVEFTGAFRTDGFFNSDDVTFVARSYVDLPRFAVTSIHFPDETYGAWTTWEVLIGTSLSNACEVRLDYRKGKAWASYWVQIGRYAGSIFWNCYMEFDPWA